MKKLSKILSRRLGRGGDDERPDPRAVSPFESAPDLHQLSSRRWRGANGESGKPALTARRAPRIGTSQIVADNDSGCIVCAAIDFPRLLDWQPGDARPWIPLSHVLALPDQHGKNGHPGNTATKDINARLSPSPSPSPAQSVISVVYCPWCDFFNSMIVTAPVDQGDDGDKRAKGKFTPYLRIRMAFERFGGGEKHELGRSVLFEVTTRNRSLPWGYVVKVAPAIDMGEKDAKGDQVKDEKVEGINACVVSYSGRGAEKVIRGRIIPPLMDPAIPRCWIEFCKQNHSAEPCAIVQSEPPIPGLRFIDCEEKRVVDAGCLTVSSARKRNGDEVHASETGGADHIEYVTLSYVSGDNRNSEAQVLIQELDPSGRLPDQLPRLIADAITVTESLGFRYLWVDRYCLPSRHMASKLSTITAASNRRRQLDLMGQIYGRSVLTIIVAAGDGVNNGIPGVSTPREEQLSLKTESGLFTTSLLRPDLEVASSKWATRAWTYQEGLLSCRRLVFTPSQLYFQCRTLHCHESLGLPLQLAPSLNLGRVFPPANTGFQPGQLRDRIRSFMTRNLTHSDERLDAFRGIMREFSCLEKRGVDHFLGLPLFHPADFVNLTVVSQTDRLVVGLGWMPTPTIKSFKNDDVDDQVIDPYRLLPDQLCAFPSWTWLSWQIQHGNEEGSDAMNHAFSFNLVNEKSPLLDGVCAPPGIEISVGFVDSTVLSWEIDGEAIARKAEKADRIEFLRVKSFCFDLSMHRKLVYVDVGSSRELTLAEPASSILGKKFTRTVEAWVRRSLGDRPTTSTVSVAISSPDPISDTTATEVAAATVEPNASFEEDYKLTAVLASGRNWKPDPSRLGSEAAATVIVFGKRNWKSDGQLVRLGALEILFEELVLGKGENPNTIMKGIKAATDGKTDLEVSVRELDLY